MYINFRASPPNVICSDVLNTYQNETTLEYMAFLEYTYLNQTRLFDSDENFDVFGQRRGLDRKISTTGALPCFCED